MLSGGTGNDELFGEQGSDELWGGAHDDKLNGGLDNTLDTLWGNGGLDMFCVEPLDVVRDRSGSETMDDGTDPTPNLGSIGDLVFIDQNENGSFDAVDQGLAGATVTLLQGSTEIATQTTGSDGSYVFGNLAAGSYTVQLPASSLGNRTATTAASFNVTLVQDQQNGDVDFGVTPTPTDPQNTASIGDLVFEDLDGDGAFDTGEPGLAGVNLALFQGSTEIATQTTASDGSYLFDNLAAGSYRVELLSSGLDDYETTTATSVDVVLAEGQANADIDFGAKALPPGTASIGDLVFEDANGNGVLDGGEVGIAGAVVTLVRDGGQIAAATTDADGKYLFENLTADTYQVLLDPASVSEYTATTATSVSVDVGSAEARDDVDFGFELADDTPSNTEQLGTAFSIPVSGLQLNGFAASYNSVVETVGNFSVVDTGVRKIVFSSVSLPFGGTVNRYRGSFPAELPSDFSEQLFSPLTVDKTVHVTNPSGSINSVVTLSQEGDVVKIGEVAETAGGPVIIPTIQPIVDEAEKARVSFDAVGQPATGIDLAPWAALFAGSLAPTTFLLTYSATNGFDLAAVEALATGLGFSQAEIVALRADLNNADYKPQLETAFSGLDVNVTGNLQIWKAIRDDPGLYWDIRQELDKQNNPTGTPGDDTSLFDGLVKPNTGDNIPTPLSAEEIKRWKTWAGRVNFKNNTAKGKAFEQVVVDDVTSNTPNAMIVAAVNMAGIDMTQTYQVYLNVYLEFPPVALASGKTISYFIADQVLFDGTNWVILEDKLSSNTSLTVNQNHALRNVTSFEVKTGRGSKNGNIGLLATTAIDSANWVKVWDTNDGTAIAGAKRIPKTP